MLKRFAVAVLVLALTLACPLDLILGKARAADCSDVTVVFARGTAETAPPVGVTGLSFAQAVRDQLPGKSVRVSAVNYPASNDFNHRFKFVENVVRGVKDTQRQVVSISKRCPKTRIIVGGYSQGAAVVNYALSERIVAPAQYERYQEKAPKPLPDAVASHVAAVILFGSPSATWIRQSDAPVMKVGPHYANKTKSYCIRGDVVCDGAGISRPNALHVLYAVNGMTVDGARYAASRAR